MPHQQDDSNADEEVITQVSSLLSTIVCCAIEIAEEMVVDQLLGLAKIFTVSVRQKYCPTSSGRKQQ